MPKPGLPYERLRNLWILVIALSVVVALRLADMQLIRYQYYRDAAERNRTQVIRQNAARGRLVTKDGVAIAENQPCFSLIYLPGRIKDPAYLERLANDFSPRLGLPAADLLDTLQNGFDKGIPTRLAENLSTRTMFAFSELKTLYPGVELVVETKRHYPYGNFASHLIGYMGQMDHNSWLQAKKDGLDYRMDSRVGKSGIEKMYEVQLKGKDGGLYLEIDSRGKLKRVLNNEPWKSGADLRLTLDFEAQKAAEEGLKSSLTKKGAVVAVDPRNGDILAIASSPDFDPNMFVTYNDSGSVKTTIKELPEYNLAVQGTFAPGSVFKIITTAAALESGRWQPEEKIFCPGYYDAGSRIFKCWEPKGHGRLDLHRALAHSCDVYFYNVGLRIGPAAIEKMERNFRLGAATGVAIPGEQSGHVFGPLERARRRSYWFIGDTLNLAIGQGELLVTPIQMAQMLAAVANRGKFWRPQFIDRITAENGDVLFSKTPELAGEISLKPETWDFIYKALNSVVQEGTGMTSLIAGINVYGKTGTAQNPQGDDNAWFAAFAEEPGKESRIAVAVLVQHGKHGASAAAPIAKKVIQAALRIKNTDASPASPALLPGRAVLPIAPARGLP